MPHWVWAMPLLETSSKNPFKFLKSFCNITLVLKSYSNIFVVILKIQKALCGWGNVEGNLAGSAGTSTFAKLCILFLPLEKVIPASCIID